MPANERSGRALAGLPRELGAAAGICAARGTGATHAGLRDAEQQAGQIVGAGGPQTFDGLRQVERQQAGQRRIGPLRAGVRREQDDVPALRFEVLVSQEGTHRLAERPIGGFIRSKPADLPGADEDRLAGAGLRQIQIAAAQHAQHQTPGDAQAAGFGLIQIVQVIVDDRRRGTQRRRHRAVRGVVRVRPPGGRGGRPAPASASDWTRCPG